MTSPVVTDYVHEVCEIVARDPSIHVAPVHSSETTTVGIRVSLSLSATSQ